MSNAVEIELAFRQLPAAEARSLAQRLQIYVESNAVSTPAPGKDAFAKWRGRGRLPAGTNTSEYLGLMRDGNGS